MNKDFEMRWSTAMQAMQARPQAERDAICKEALKLANKTGATTALCFVAIMETRK